MLPNHGMFDALQSFKLQAPPVLRQCDRPELPRLLYISKKRYFFSTFFSSNKNTKRFESLHDEIAWKLATRAKWMHINAAISTRCTHICILHNAFKPSPPFDTQRDKERVERGREAEGRRRRGASVLYVQREFEHVFHLNICTWNSNVANLHKTSSTRSLWQTPSKRLHPV